MEGKTYYIFRSYAPHMKRERETFPNDPKMNGLTLEEAQEHCQSEDSACRDWFEGYMEE